MAKKYTLPKVEELLEAGVHFGHQVKRRNPSMDKYIYSEDNKSHVINVFKTLENLEEACDFLYETAKSGGQIVLVGTKRQSGALIEKYAKEAGILYVSQRWLGGTFTNYDSVKTKLKKLADLIEGVEKGTFASYTKKERLLIDREIEKLETFVGGIRELKRYPDAVVVVDIKREKTVVKEAAAVKVPVVALVDTNSDPSGVDYVVPGNDDAIKSIEIFLKTISDAIINGYKDNKPKKEEASEAKVSKVSKKTDTKKKTPTKTNAKTKKVVKK